MTFRVAGEKIVTLYDSSEEAARSQAARCTWSDIADGEYAEDSAADSDEWCKIEIIAVEDKGELPPPRPSLYSEPGITAIKSLPAAYALDALRTYDGSADHLYRHIYILAMALGGEVNGPSPDQLDTLRGYKAGEIEASTYSAMPLQKVVEDMLSLRLRLAKVMDDAESAHPSREEYQRLLKELRFRDQREAGMSGHARRSEAIIRAQISADQSETPGLLEHSWIDSAVAKIANFNKPRRDRCNRRRKAEEPRPPVVRIRQSELHADAELM